MIILNRRYFYNISQRIKNKKNAGKIKKFL